MTTEIIGGSISYTEKFSKGDDKMFDVRDCLKPAIERSRIKQFAIAEMMGLNDQQLSDIVNKRRKMEANELINFCKAIQISPNELLTFGVTDSTKQPA